MENFEKKQGQNNLIEQGQARLYYDYLKLRRDRFEFAQVSEILAKDKIEEDYLMLNEALTNWSSKSKNEGQKKELFDLLQGLWRINSYTINMETTYKNAVSKYVDIEAANERLVAEKYRIQTTTSNQIAYLEKEVESLKKQIEFLSK